MKLKFEVVPPPSRTPITMRRDGLNKRQLRDRAANLPGSAKTSGRLSRVMDAKHTPGPWTAFQRPAEVGTNYSRILLHGHPDRQDLHGQDSLSGYCGEANASLIAAAPETAAERDRLKAENAELLAALRAVVLERARMDLSADDADAFYEAADCFRDAMDVACAIIAKAEGRAE